MGVRLRWLTRQSFLAVQHRRTARLVAVETITQNSFQTFNNTQQPEAMLRALCSAALVASLVSGLPLSDNTLTVDTLDTSHENIINVDEKPDKLVEVDLRSVPLGSQFAVDYFFPDRKKLETGHRIPLHLFPIETQNRILEVGEDTKVEDTAEEVQEEAKEEAKEEIQEEVQEEKYVDASSFRQAPAVPTGLSHSELSLRNLFGQEYEGDKTYQDTLSVFAPPSFFA